MLVMTSERAYESTGRFGETRKVPLKIMVDKPVKDALGKIRTKKSVSNLVNGFLTIIVRQFDPGPSSPLIYELRELFQKHMLKAKRFGHNEEVVCIEYLESQLEPYYDLAGVNANDTRERVSEGVEAEIMPSTESFVHDYSWYSTPHICHGTPMAYSQRERSWKCSICESRYYEY